jgi:hypothetical protein
MLDIPIGYADEPSILKANDICDRCNARAYVLVVFTGDTSLLFCGHHWTIYGEALLDVAIDVIDETHMISA